MVAASGYPSASAGKCSLKCNRGCGSPARCLRVAAVARARASMSFLIMTLDTT